MNKAIKLFFIAGTPWIFEIFAWLPSYFKTGISPQWRQNTVYLFAVSNTLNALRGVVVFIMFVLLQRDVRRYLWLRLNKFWFDSPVRSWSLCLWFSKFCTRYQEPPGTSVETQSQSSSKTTQMTSESRSLPNSGSSNTSHP